MSGWNHVRDKMPDINKMVLFLTVYAVPAKWFWDGLKWRQGSTWCYSSGYINNDITSRVTHWMPLPQPPEQD